MDLLAIFVAFVFCFAIEILYFKIADRYNIIDKPNHRSSHTMITIRGGGVVFSLSLLLACFYLGWEYKFFFTGLMLISIVSFIDDIKPVSSSLRISIHLGAVALMFYQLDMYTQPVLLILLGLFFVIGSINAINFMDGINGITGSYSLVALLTLFYINRYVIQFTIEGYLIFPIIALLVFNFFNFRSKAKCFAGDVGSVSIAFIILFFLLQLIIKTGNIGYIMLLLMYGLDSAITLVLRIIRKEKIFEAHRRHLYQYLVNEKGYRHLSVATLYCALQLIINIVLIWVLPISALYSVLILVVGVLVYLSTRLNIEGYKKLFGLNK